MSVNVPHSLKELDQHVVQQWRDEGHEWPTQLHKIVIWGLENDLLEYPQASGVKLLAKRMAASLREEYTTDPQGRRVRQKHCYPELIESPSGMKRQLTWFDKDSGTPEQMQASVQYRRTQIISDAVQLRKDVDSYNDNNSHGAQLLLPLDFTDDVEERLQSTTYIPPELPDDI